MTTRFSRRSSFTTFSARILPHFVLFLVWITDLYYRSPQILTQLESESFVREKYGERHSDFYLNRGESNKGPSFSVEALRTLVRNPDRKNVPPKGRLDRGSLILLCLLLSGDVELNPGPVFTRRMAREARKKDQQLQLQLASENSEAVTKDNFSSSLPPVSPQPTVNCVLPAAEPLITKAQRDDRGGEAAANAEGTADRGDDREGAEGIAGRGLPDTESYYGAENRDDSVVVAVAEATAGRGAHE